MYFQCSCFFSYGLFCLHLMHYSFLLLLLRQIVLSFFFFSIFIADQTIFEGVSTMCISTNVGSVYQWHMQPDYQMNFLSVSMTALNRYTSPSAFLVLSNFTRQNKFWISISSRLLYLKILLQVSFRSPLSPLHFKKCNIK